MAYNPVMARMFRNIALSLAVIMLALSCQSVSDGPDYALPENWAYLAEGDGKAADLFLICPTVDMGEDGNLNMLMDDEAVKESFVGALNMERGIYEDSAVMYAPFYRQMTFPVYADGLAGSGRHLEIAYGDTEKAFLYYMEHLNNGRPLILAGFSQGAQLALMLLMDHFDDPMLQDRLIAAYLIGWKVTEDDLEAYPHLRMAAGEDDTGVIVSFNTESPETHDSIIVPDGVRTLGINPLNWETDSTPADRSLNKGACLTDYSGAVAEEIPGLTGAYLDPERGTLKAVDIIPSDYSNDLFPDGVYHLYDYQFFFRNLEENAAVRTEAWLEEHR